MNIKEIMEIAQQGADLLYKASDEVRNYMEEQADFLDDTVSQDDLEELDIALYGAAENVEIELDYAKSIYGHR